MKEEKKKQQYVKVRKEGGSTVLAIRFVPPEWELVRIVEESRGEAWVEVRIEKVA